MGRKRKIIMNDKVMKHKSSQKKTPLKGFLQTFFVAFIVFAFCCTSVLMVVDSMSNIKLLDKSEEEQPELEEQLAVLVDRDSPFFQAFKDSKRVNMLLMGVNGGMTDTIMLVSFDRETSSLDVISIPRDTYYERAGYVGAAERKLNAAYRGNPVNTAYAVSDILLGMPINYYAVIEYDGVKAIVDSMGGVPMDIPFHMVYNDPYDTPPLRINIPAGPQVLDGEHAVQFLRYRKGYTEGDIGRVKAQQEFVKSAVKQSLSFQLPKVAKTVFNNVDSNITLGTAISLATKAVGMSAENMNTYLMPHTLQDEAPWYVYPDSTGIAEMLNTIYSIKPAETTDGAISGAGISDQ